MSTLTFELDISSWEMNHTHWAVKEVNIQQELSRARGILLPAWVSVTAKGVNLANHVFDVALSFPGEARHYVQHVAAGLEHLIGPDRYSTMEIMWHSSRGHRSTHSFKPFIATGQS